MSVEIHWTYESIRRGPDAHVGAQITQFTSQPVISQNIYCEERYTSADGSRFAFLRTPFGGPSQLWVCDIPAGRVARLADGVTGAISSNIFQDTLYFARVLENGKQALACVDLNSLEQTDLLTFEDSPKPGSCCISPDGRTLISGMRVRDDIYGIYRVNLADGSWEVFHEYKDILNPHLQFEPSEGKEIMVQWNRGGSLDEFGNIIRLVGEEGATLYVIDADGGNFRQLPVGKPYTAPVTGHECWVGRTKKVLLTTANGPKEGRLFLATPGEDEARLVCRGYALNHISASADGRFFVGDDSGTGRLYLGSLETGKTRAIGESGASGGRPQYSHAHPYLTPDNRFVIYNSDQTGIAQVCGAAVPDGFLESLL